MMNVREWGRDLSKASRKGFKTKTISKYYIFIVEGKRIQIKVAQGKEENLKSNLGVL